VWHASGPAAPDATAPWHREARGREWAGGGAESGSSPPRSLEWEQLALLCRWPEQLAYEEIRPLTLFGSSVAERSRETGTAERTLYRRLSRFEKEGVENLFGSEHARRKRLPSAMRRLVVDLKAEYPGFNPNEIAGVVYVRFGRRPDRKTVQRVLEEEPIPLRFVRRFAPYHEIRAMHTRGLDNLLVPTAWPHKAFESAANLVREASHKGIRQTAKWWLRAGEARSRQPRRPARDDPRRDAPGFCCSPG
jgi:hypothetical protein